MRRHIAKLETCWIGTGEEESAPWNTITLISKVKRKAQVPTYDGSLKEETLVEYIREFESPNMRRQLTLIK